MNILTRIAQAIRRARLAIAEQDLARMEEIGAHNLRRQRDQVAALREQLGHNSTAPIRANDIARAVARRARGQESNSTTSMSSS